MDSKATVESKSESKRPFFAFAIDGRTNLVHKLEISDTDTAHDLVLRLLASSCGRMLPFRDAAQLEELVVRCRLYFGSFQLNAADTRKTPVRQLLHPKLPDRACLFFVYPSAPTTVFVHLTDEDRVVSLPVLPAACTAQTIFEDLTSKMGLTDISMCTHYLENSMLQPAFVHPDQTIAEAMLDKEDIIFLTLRRAGSLNLLMDLTHTAADAKRATCPRTWYKRVFNKTPTGVGAECSYQVMQLPPSFGFNNDKNNHIFPSTSFVPFGDEDSIREQEQQHMLSLSVRTPWANHFGGKMLACKSVRALKAALRGPFGPPLARFFLAHMGTLLTDEERSLRDYDVEDEDHLQVVLNLAQIAPTSEFAELVHVQADCLPGRPTFCALVHRGLWTVRNLADLCESFFHVRAQVQELRFRGVDLLNGQAGSKLRDLVLADRKAYPAGSGSGCGMHRPPLFRLNRMQTDLRSTGELRPDDIRVPGSVWLRKPEPRELALLSKRERAELTESLLRLHQLPTAQKTESSSSSDWPSAFTGHLVGFSHEQSERLLDLVAPAFRRKALGGCDRHTVSVPLTEQEVLGVLGPRLLSALRVAGGFSAKHKPTFEVVRDSALPFEQDVKSSPVEEGRAGFSLGPSLPEEDVRIGAFHTTGATTLLVCLADEQRCARGGRIAIAHPASSGNPSAPEAHVEICHKRKVGDFTLLQADTLFGLTALRSGHRLNLLVR